MTAKEIREEITSLTNDIQFYYKDKHCFIDPFNIHKFLLVYGNVNKIYADIDELMNDLIFDGKSLNDIAENIEIL